MPEAEPFVKIVVNRPKCNSVRVYWPVTIRKNKGNIYNFSYDKNVLFSLEEMK